MLGAIIAGVMAWELNDQTLVFVNALRIVGLVRALTCARL